MDQALQALFSTAFLAFAVVIALAVLALRRVSEALFALAAGKISKRLQSILVVLWREWILRALPIAIGGILAHTITSYPYPTEFSSSSGRWFFGIIAGLLSSSIYAFVKSHVAKLTGVQ